MRTNIMKSKPDMCSGPLFKNIILYTIPIIFTGILQLLFNSADLVVVGHFRGSTSLAAVGATGAIINLVINLFIGLSIGVSVAVSQGIGAGNSDDVSKTVHTAIPTAIISGIILTIIGILGAKFFLTLMDTPDNVIGLSTMYMKIYFCGITSSMIYNFGSAILRAAGDTVSPLIFLIAAGITNVILNIFFVMICSMNVEGVAMATAISQTISAALVIMALIKRTDSCKLSIKKIRFYKNQLIKIIRVGLPAGIQASLFSASNVIIQSSVNSFGSIAMAGNAASQNIEGFVYITMNSYHQTALNFTGQNYGASNLDRIKKILSITLSSVLFTGIVFGTAVYLLADPLLSIYISDSSEAVQYGIIRMKYICLTYFLCGIMDVMTGMLRGIGSSFAPMVITILGVCGLRIGWIYTIFKLPSYHSLESLYLSYPVSWFITFAIQFLLFIIIFKKKNKTISNPIIDKEKK